MKKKRFKNIYEYLPDYDNISEEEKIIIGNKILNNKNSKEIELMNKYVNYETSKGIETEQAKKYTKSFRNMYKNYVKNMNKPPLIDKKMIDYLPDYDNISEEEKKDLCNQCFNELLDKYKDAILKDMKHQIIHSFCYKEAIDYYNGINSLKKLYYKKTHTDIKKHYNMYELFNATSEEEKKALDIIYDRLTNNEKEALNMYLNRKLTQLDSYDGVRVLNVLNRMKTALINYKENNGFIEKNLYNYFEDYEWISFEEKKNIINSLIDSEYIKLIKEYVDGKYTRLSNEGRRVTSIITCAKEKYRKVVLRKYIELVLQKEFSKNFLNNISYQNKILLYDIITKKPLTKKDLVKLYYLKKIIKKNIIVTEEDKKIVLGIR